MSRLFIVKLADPRPGGADILALDVDAKNTDHVEFTITSGWLETRSGQMTQDLTPAEIEPLHENDEVVAAVSETLYEIERDDDRPELDQ